MTTSQKAALSLLISVVLAAGFSMLAFTGFFNLVETRFYNPSITNSLSKEVELDAGAIQNFLDETRDVFSSLLENDAVKRSFLSNQSAEDIFERTRVYGMLFESQSGLQSVRFIDAGGVRLHFSTDPADLLSRGAETISYKNYDETLPFVPYPELAVPAAGNPKITLDGANDRIIFSFPFTDSMGVYRGTALYALSVRAVTGRLMSEGRITAGEKLSIVSNPPGMVSGIPGSLVTRDAVVPVISSIWREGIVHFTALDSAASDSSLALISARTGQGLWVGRVVNESLFEFPHSMKIILLTAMFLTVFLSIFLVFNLQPDTITVVQNRLKNLQLSLIREYYERKGEMDWNHWYRELEQRREDIRGELKRGIREKPALLEDIDSLIDKSWDEILTAIGGKRETRLAIDEDKLQSILSRMLAAAGTMPLVPGAAPPAPIFSAEAGRTAASPEAPAELEELSELEEPDAPEGTVVSFKGQSGEDDIAELEELEELEEPDEAGETAAAELEELEAFGELEDLGEAVESGELEELDEAEAAAVVVPRKPVPGAAPPVPKSNVQLVFGEDDIPTIVETSGLELVDDLSDGIDFDSELEELERLEEAEDTADSPVVPVHAAREVDVASQIEFGGMGKPDDSAKPEDNPEFVIVSPFSGMFSKLSNDDALALDENDKKAEPGQLEEINGSMSLVHVPFQNEVSGEPEELPSEDQSIIKRKNGVNYVDEKVKTPDTETAKSLDPGFKNLVDSVIGKK